MVMACVRSVGSLNEVSIELCHLLLNGDLVPLREGDQLCWIEFRERAESFEVVVISPTSQAVDAAQPASDCWIIHGVVQFAHRFATHRGLEMNRRRFPTRTGELTKRAEF